jgi:hypothetical protein
MINGLQVEAVDLKDKLIETRAIFLFSIGKTPLAIELNMPAICKKSSRLSTNFMSWLLSTARSKPFCHHF